MQARCDSRCSVGGHTEHGERRCRRLGRVYEHDEGLSAAIGRRRAAEAATWPFPGRHESHSEIEDETPIFHALTVGGWRSRQRGSGDAVRAVHRPTVRRPRSSAEGPAPARRETVSTGTVADALAAFHAGAVGAGAARAAGPGAGLRPVRDRPPAGGRRPASPRRPRLSGDTDAGRGERPVHGRCAGTRAPRDIGGDRLGSRSSARSARAGAWGRVGPTAGTGPACVRHGRAVPDGPESWGARLGCTRGE